ncbi:putative Uclacyanin 1 [Hibiscus syriacus]|uniref:Uclacyanin 1 n=1 Tax=Hibiscus syriacus TaxID=106335 RepID=A0A6A2WK38_HIBSY|nr:putative Uclacyanin 1 [Hibiscus syriacus]
MARHHSLVIFAIVALMAPVIASATEHVVGGDDGWALGVKYDEWAKDKQFFVGDTLGMGMGRVFGPPDPRTKNLPPDTRSDQNKISHDPTRSDPNITFKKLDPNPIFFNPSRSGRNPSGSGLMPIPSQIFKYKANAHNVYKVTGDQFKSCTVPSNNSLGSFTGNDTINLATSGTKWYICGINGHCDGGMKLKITVLDGAPAPAPTSASTLFAKATGFHVLLGVIFAIAALIMA